MKDCDIAVIGGGLLGAAFAYGLSAPQRSVVLIDEGDHAVRSARGNFGLVWVQGKGRGMPEYARWSQASSQAWPALADRLQQETGVNVGYHKPGGFLVAITEPEFEANQNLLAELRRDAIAAGREYDYEVVQRAQLTGQLPGIGEQVPGATYCPHDGHVNPLKLLRALHQSFQQRGGQYLPRNRVQRIAPVSGGGFEISTDDESVIARAQKVVLAAGLGSAELGKQLDLTIPIFPLQGQIVVTEAAAPLLPYPTNYVRQTDEGQFMLGPSARDVGMDLSTRTGTLRDIADQCARAFPYLRQLRVQRAWAALRIMTPDGYAVYQQSARYPGAFSFACHSGVTLAAMHATEVSGWVLSGEIPADYHCFGAQRFDVQASSATH